MAQQFLSSPQTIVVLNTGGPVSMKPWLNDAAAVVQAWYPGQEGGNAIADILLGSSSEDIRLKHRVLLKMP